MPFLGEASIFEWNWGVFFVEFRAPPSSLGNSLESAPITMEVAGEPMRVQSLAQSGVIHVPPQYIQSPQHRPKHSSSPSSHPNSTIPLIDLFGSDPTRRDSARDAIGRACTEWGAFHVTGHGIPTDLLRRVKRVGLTFFNKCPIAEKLRYACDPTASASEGYGSRMLERDDTVLDWRDYFDHHTLPLSRRIPSRWPHFPAEYRSTLAEYSDRMGSLASELLGLVSESLGLPTRCIEDAVGEFYQNITISYYPPCPQPELTLGLQEHSDMGAITLLVQDEVGGLEVVKDGEWVGVQPLDDDAIVVLLADQTEVLSLLLRISRYRHCKFLMWFLWMKFGVYWWIRNWV